MWYIQGRVTALLEHFDLFIFENLETAFSVQSWLAKIEKMDSF